MIYQTQHFGMDTRKIEIFILVLILLFVNCMPPVLSGDWQSIRIYLVLFVSFCLSVPRLNVHLAFYNCDVRRLFCLFFFFRSSIIDSEYILLVTYATSTTAFCLAHYKLNDMWANTREPMAVTQQKRSKHNLIYHSRTFFFSSSRFAFSIPDSKSPIVHKYRCVFFRQWFAYQLKRQSQNIVDGLPIWYDKHWNIEVINDAEALMEPVVVWNIFAWHWRELIQLTVECALWFPVWFMYSYLLFVCRETRSLSLKWFGPISVIAMPWDSPTSSFCVM